MTPQARAHTPAEHAALGFKSASLEFAKAAEQAGLPVCRCSSPFCYVAEWAWALRASLQRSFGAYGFGPIERAVKAVGVEAVEAAYRVGGAGAVLALSRELP